MNEYDNGYHDGTVHHLDKINRLTAQLDASQALLAEWHKVFGHLSKDADTAGNMINDGIAERDAEITKLKEIQDSLVVEKYILQDSIDYWLGEINGMKKTVYTTNLYLRKCVAKYQTENAALREEVERLKVCLFQMQEAAKEQSAIKTFGSDEEEY